MNWSAFNSALKIIVIPLYHLRIAKIGCKKGCCETSGFLMLSGGIKRDQCHEMG